MLLAPSSAEFVHSAGAPALEEEKVEICYHTVQTELSLTSGRPETVMVEDDTPRVADLPKTFALGLLQRTCFRKSDVRLDTGHLSSSIALNKIAPASMLSPAWVELQIASCFCSRALLCLLN